MNENGILLIGGGGNCKSVLDTILSLNEYEEIGIIDKQRKGKLFGVPMLGTDDDLPRLREEGWSKAVVSVGSVGDTTLRRRFFSMLSELGFSFPVIIDPTAAVSSNAEIGEGTFIGKKAIVNAGSVIGPVCIINSGAIVEHDCCVGAFSHISVGAVLCGGTVVGSDSHIGAGSTVRQQIRIGSSVMIGAGSVVVKDVPDGAKAFGNPCRVVD